MTIEFKAKIRKKDTTTKRLYLEVPIPVRHKVNADQDYNVILEELGR